MMKILVHDYTGHGFQTDLSRQLAVLGHEVLHVSCASFPAPKGPLNLREGDPEGLQFQALSMRGGVFHKHSYVSRWRQERAYGHDLARLLSQWCPDVLLIGNTPLDPLQYTLKTARRLGIANVFWQQDIYSVAINRYLSAKQGLMGLLGPWIGRYYTAKEAAVARSVDAVIPISEGFVPILKDWGVAAERVEVIPNWASLTDFPQHPKDNAWAREQGLVDVDVLLYAGTIGLKHEPKKLLLLAESLKDRPKTVMVVVSSGVAADWLQSEATLRGLKNLRVLPFQSMEQVAMMQASADVLLSVLESGAGVFSVPSKVLSQLCAGRALLASLPEDNDAAKMIRQAGAGRVVSPDVDEDWIEAAHQLLDDPQGRGQMGTAARAYAQRHFDSASIAAHFLAVLETVRRP